MQRIISFLVVNEVGVLTRASGLLSKRGFNVDSITAGVTSNPDITRITLALQADDKVIEQVIKQFAKLLDVIAIKELPAEKSTLRELALVKLSTVDVDKEALCDSIITKKGVIVSMGDDYVTAQFTGSSTGINACIKAMSENKIIEIARTGLIAMESSGEKL